MSSGRVLPPGTVIANEWRVERKLGEGGFGITYAATNLRIGGLVALKEYFPAACGTRPEGTTEVMPATGKEGEVFRWGMRRFIREAETLAKLDHPSIVRVEGFFEANRTAYMVLEYIEGGTLKHWLRNLKRRPTQAELDRILDRLTAALSQVHAIDLLHRDIKPDNVMMRQDGTPVLIDFGAAKASIAGHTRMVAGPDSIAARTLAIVSDGYSPPEQYASEGKLQGPFTDIYALGATIYRAIVGATPQPSSARMLSESYRALAQSAAAGKYRLAFLEAVDGALRLRREERPQSMEELRLRLGLDGHHDPSEPVADEYDFALLPTQGHSTLPVPSRNSRNSKSAAPRPLVSAVSASPGAVDLPLAPAPVAAAPASARFVIVLGCLLIASGLLLASWLLLSGRQSKVGAASAPPPAAAESRLAPVQSNRVPAIEPGPRLERPDDGPARVTLSEPQAPSTDKLPAARPGGTPSDPRSR